MDKQFSQSHTQNQIVYTAADGKVMANVLFANDTFWLTQSVMSELFGVKTSAICKHLKNIYESKELSPEATVSKMEIVQMERGTTRIVMKRFPLNVSERFINHNNNLNNGH